MIKREEIKEAIKLRVNNGLSIGEISKKINIPYTTITRWVKKYPLTKEQDIQLAIRNPFYKNGDNAPKIYSEKFKAERLKYQNEGREIVRLNNNSLLVTGAMLYWGEGAKSRNMLDFTNSDPYMIKIFIKFLQSELNVTEDEITIYIQCYTDICNISTIEDFWVKTTGLKRDNLRKSTINNYPISSKKTKIGKSKYGTCKLRVCNVKTIQTLYGFIKELSGIDDDDLWL